MRSFVFAIAASALLASSGVEAAKARRHAHAEAHAHFDLNARNYQAAPESVCPPLPCTTYTSTTWVLYTAPSSSAVYHKPTKASTTSSTSCPIVTVPYTPSAPAPYPEVTTCPTAGIYTIPAKAITLTAVQTVCVPTTTVYQTPGTYYPGKQTTVVTCSTVVPVPYATIVTKSETAYTTITTSTLTCHSAGTYTYGGIPHTVTTGSATCTYPVLATYSPATYTHPASVITVTETQYAVTCPYEVYVTPSSKPVYSTKTTLSAYSVSSSSAAAYSSPTKVHTAPIKPTGSYGAIGGVAKQWCITYSPYNADTTCRAAADIKADIADIASKGFSAIRMYSANCGALEAVSHACETHGLKLVMGVWIEAGGLDSAYVDLAKIIAWGKWELVELMVIGNEAIFNGYISSADLASFIVACRGKLSAAGYNGPVTTSETVAVVQANPGICAVIDVVGVNIHPYFNAQTTADNAGTFLLGQLGIAGGVCGKTAYALECGWPSAGDANGVAIPGFPQQKTALDAIYAVDMGRITYFTYTNDMWKNPGSYGVEQNFGCIKSFPFNGGSSY